MTHEQLQDAHIAALREIVEQRAEIERLQAQLATAKGEGSSKADKECLAKYEKKLKSGSYVLSIKDITNKTYIKPMLAETYYSEVFDPETNKSKVKNNIPSKKEFNKSEWQSIFRQLIAMNFLFVNIANHGGLNITKEGMAFLKNKGSVNFRKTSPKTNFKTSC